MVSLTQNFCCVAAALLIATCISIPTVPEAVVPEDVEHAVKDSYYIQIQDKLRADYEQAQERLLQLKKAGKDDKACRDLATEAIEQIEDAQKQKQDMLDALPDGSKCGDNSAVDAAMKELNKVKDTLNDADDELKKILQEPVKFEVPLEELGNGACYNAAAADSYKKASEEAEKARTAKDKASGEVDAAENAHTQAAQDAADARSKCLCETQALHTKEWAAASKISSDKEWKKAHLMRCVLDSTEMSECKVPELKPVQKPEVVPAVEDAKCNGEEPKAAEEEKEKEKEEETDDMPCWKKPVAFPGHEERVALTCDPKTQKFTGIEMEAFKNKEGSFKDEWSKRRMERQQSMLDGTRLDGLCKHCNVPGCTADGCCTLALC